MDAVTIAPRHAHRWARRVAWLVSAGTPLLGAAATPSPDLAKAIAGVLGYDQMSAGLVAYCEDQAPAQAGPVREAWQRWRRANQLSQIEAAAGPKVLETAHRLFEDQAPRLRQSLASKGSAAAVCAQMPGTWSEPSMDAHRQFPLAYRADGSAASPQADALTGTNADLHTIAKPSGTVYTVAQLSALGSQWHRNDTVYVRGTVIQQGRSVFVVQQDQGFKSRVLLHADIDLRSQLGRDVVLQGRLERRPVMGMVELQNARLVQDASALTASNLPQSGLQRAQVALDNVRAAPGHGLAAGELAGVLLSSRTKVGGGMDEHVVYLLRDGTAYLRGELPPSDLDVPRSRELEPQQWAHWRKAGNSYEIRRQDDFGKPDGDWQRLDGVIAAPWNAGSRVAGHYSASNFYGSITLGGTYSKSSITLGRDGHFTTSRLSESGSGSMAANGGFNAHASTYSGTSGTHSTAGGGSGSVFASSQRSRDDGADHHGTYRLDGYTVELHYDSGRVERGLSFPQGSKMLYWLDRVYLRDE